jgi:hypothetical protein
MRRVALAIGVALVAGSMNAGIAWGQATATPTMTATPTATATSTPTATALPPLPAPAAAPAGVAVVALPGASDAAWPLAQAVYANPGLRPAALDEARARVLCGEKAPAGAPQEVRDLADTVAAVKGDDAPSRMMLGEIAHRLNVRALAVVRVDAGRPGARLFLPESGAFDAASYAPDEAPTLAWTGAVRSFARAYGAEPAPPLTAAPATTPGSPNSAPPLATHDEPVLSTTPPKKKAFYESGWFWGALGAAAFAGGAVFFATRDNGASTIHLQMQVPH